MSTLSSGFGARGVRGGLLGAVALSLSCSLGPRPQVCEANATCRDAFGLGWLCGDEGYCEQAPPNARCNTSWPPDLLRAPEKYADAIVLGSLFDHSTDVPEVRSAGLAVRQVGDNDGLQGRTFGIVHCNYQEDIELDDLDNDAAAAASARWLVDVLGVKALIGPPTSDQATVVYEEVSGDGVVIISPSATSPLLTTIDGEISNDASPGLFWRTVPPDDLQGAAIAEDLATRGVGSIAIIHQQGVYATALADVVEGAYAGAIQRYQFANDSGLIDAFSDAVLEDIEEIIFLSGSVTDVITFLNAAAPHPRFQGAVDEEDPEPLRIFLADAAADPAVIDGPPAMLPLIRGTRPQVPGGPVYDTFASAYSATYQLDPSQSVYTSFTYDAAWLAMYGIAWSVLQEGGIEGPGIARGLRRVSGPASTPTNVRASSWPVVVNAFQAGERVDLVGASGPLDFDPDTGEVAVPIEVWVIEGGEFVPVALCDSGGCEELGA